VSLDVFLTRYVDGVETVLDPVAVRTVLEPHVVERDAEHEFVRIGTEDDSLEVFGYGDDMDSLMLEIDGDDVRRIVLDLARTVGGVLGVTDGPVAVTDETLLAQLPTELRGGAVVVTSVEQFSEFLAAQP